MRKRISWVIYAVTVIFMVLLQTSFFPQFILLRVKPDLVLLFVISVGLLKGYREGVIVGALSGILTGLISGNVWGIYVITYCLAGFAAGLVPEKVEPDNFIIPLASGLVGSAGASVLFTLLGQSLELFFPTGDDIYKILIFLGWNAFFCIPVFLLAKYALVAPGIEMDTRSPGIKSDYIIE